MSNDFIVSVHALVRFEERFPELWISEEQAAKLIQSEDEDDIAEFRDQQVAELIHRECDDAIAAGRASYIAPLELANNDLDRWEAGKGLVVWVQSKERGYVLMEIPNEGTLVTTVLKGKSSPEAKKMVYGEGGGRPRRRPRKEAQSEHH